jgi:hypothetical protein
MDLEDFTFQMKAFGGVLFGGPDWTANMCEARGSRVTRQDRTKAFLTTQRLRRTYDGPWAPVPEHWALPGVTMLLMQEEMNDDQV